MKHADPVPLTVLDSSLALRTRLHPYLVNAKFVAFLYNLFGNRRRYHNIDNVRPFRETSQVRIALLSTYRATVGMNRIRLVTSPQQVKEYPVTVFARGVAHTDYGNDVLFVQKRGYQMVVNIHFSTVTKTTEPTQIVNHHCDVVNVENVLIRGNSGRQHRKPGASSVPPPGLREGLDKDPLLDTRLLHRSILLLADLLNAVLANR